LRHDVFVIFYQRPSITAASKHNNAVDDISVEPCKAITKYTDETEMSMGFTVARAEDPPAP